MTLLGAAWWWRQIVLQVRFCGTHWRDIDFSNRGKVTPYTGNFQGSSLVFLCILWKKIANSSEGFYWKSNITKQNKTRCGCKCEHLYDRRTSEATLCLWTCININIFYSLSRKSKVDTLKGSLSTSNLTRIKGHAGFPASRDHVSSATLGNSAARGRK